MARAHRDAALRFLRTVFEPSDWGAVVLKSYESGRVVQRVGPISWLSSEPFQNWLRTMNAGHFNIFVTVNAIAAGRRSRTREAISAVRHVFLDADHDGSAVLSDLETHTDIPSPSYVLHSSPNHIHVFWRAAEFDTDSVERLQRRLARQLHADPAATPVTQTTRLPGFFNHKRSQPHLVTIDYLNVDVRYGPTDFPAVQVAPEWDQSVRRPASPLYSTAIERARRYLASVPPAIAGQHGDVHTFRVCCRLTRGFALTDDQALDALAEWNMRCQPPWSPEELVHKVHHATRYGREPIGGLL